MDVYQKFDRSRGFCGFRDAMIVANSSAVVIGIFFAVDRCHMGWIFIKIRSPDSKLLAVHVDPFPQVFA